MKRLVNTAYALRISTKTSLLVGIVLIFGGFYLYVVLGFLNFAFFMNIFRLYLPTGDFFRFI